MTAKNFDELRNIVANEMPTFMASSYADALPAAGAWDNMRAADKAWPFEAQPAPRVARRLIEPQLTHALIQAKQPRPQPETPMTDESSRRLVRILVVDPDEQVPNDIALLFDSKEMFTDKTDQELYFEIGLGAFLTAHNEKRTKIVNKTIKDRTEHLEPARIRDLKMLVLTLAKF